MRKTRLRAAKPLAARVCGIRRGLVSTIWQCSVARRALKTLGSRESAYNHSVVPGKDGKLIEAGDKVPSSGDVASYEDAKSQDGEGVHMWKSRAADYGWSIPQRGGDAIGLCSTLFRRCGRRDLWDHVADCRSRLGAKSRRDAHTVAFKGKRGAFSIEVPDLESRSQVNLWVTAAPPGNTESANNSLAFSICRLRSRWYLGTV
jgi:hypothetical protein